MWRSAVQKAFSPNRVRTWVSEHTQLMPIHIHIRAACSMMAPEDPDNSLPMVDSDASSESWERVHEDSDAMPPECVGAPTQYLTRNTCSRASAQAARLSVLRA